jgi:hypothetical protein
VSRRRRAVQQSRRAGRSRRARSRSPGTEGARSSGGEWIGTLDADTSGSRLKLSSRWILDGHVLETTITMNDDKCQMLRTWDKANQRYLVTYMDASGTALLMTGQWNEDQRELTTHGKQGAKIVTLTTKFVDDNTTRWTIRDGENVITGLNRRNSR